MLVMVQILFADVVRLVDFVVGLAIFNVVSMCLGLIHRVKMLFVPGMPLCSMHCLGISLNIIELVLTGHLFPWVY